MPTKTHAPTAAELMKKDVIRLDADASVEEARGLLEDAGISGAA